MPAEGIFHDAHEVYLCSDNEHIPDRWIATFSELAFAEAYLRVCPSMPGSLRFEVRPV